MPPLKHDPELDGLIRQINSKDATGAFAAALVDPKFASKRTEIARICWESQLDFSGHLLLFTHLIITGDFLLALESFSVIENTFLERPVSPELSKEISSLLKNSVPDQPEVKQRLIRELILVIDPFIPGN
ncbi:MAG: hypothetical protein A2X22_03265 [Bacteroidetes bacterium GWF2_49_14]|nr:MAG: hypothetical protein A2X22_03265 [Bacteroidetes bacterium GWF2_49_14]HBB90996.1 hypothetical protein [Bacteroidales bacterium]